MISENPFAEFRKECEIALANALKKALEFATDPGMIEQAEDIIQELGG